MFMLTRGTFEYLLLLATRFGHLLGAHYLLFDMMGDSRAWIMSAFVSFPCMHVSFARNDRGDPLLF